MSKQKRNKEQGGIVFSTDPDFRPGREEEPETLAPAKQQTLRIWLQRVKGGKEATIIRGFAGPSDELAELARTLKNKCATGGNAKDGEIILQGDHRDKVLKMLVDLGYRNTKKAGG